jgi:hypothetical protein
MQLSELAALIGSVGGVSAVVVGGVFWARRRRRRLRRGRGAQLPPYGSPPSSRSVQQEAYRPPSGPRDHSTPPGPPVGDDDWDDEDT